MGSQVCTHHASGNRYMETYYNWNIQITSGKYRIIEAYIHINMVIDVHEYGRDKCIWMFQYAVACLFNGLFVCKSPHHEDPQAVENA